MSIEQVALVVGSLIVMPFWFMMIFLPYWEYTKRVCGSLWIIVPPAAMYIILMILSIFNGRATDLATASIIEAEGLARLFSDSYIVVIGWLHYLAFDLFVGRWVYLDSRERKLTAWPVSVTILLVLMVGPLGLMAYLLLRQFLTQKNAL